MTRDEALAALRAIVDRGAEDPEVDHSEADDILIALIDDKEISEAYADIRKWYA